MKNFMHTASPHTIHTLHRYTGKQMHTRSHTLQPPNSVTAGSLMQAYVPTFTCSSPQWAHGHTSHKHSLPICCPSPAPHWD